MVGNEEKIIDRWPYDELERGRMQSVFSVMILKKQGISCFLVAALLSFCQGFVLYRLTTCRLIFSSMILTFLAKKKLYLVFVEKTDAEDFGTQKISGRNTLCTGMCWWPTYPRNRRTEHLHFSNDIFSSQLFTPYGESVLVAMVRHQLPKESCFDVLTKKFRPGTIKDNQYVEGGVLFLLSLVLPFQSCISCKK